MSITAINVVSGLLVGTIGMGLMVAGAMANDSGRGGVFVYVFQFLALSYPLTYLVGLISSISVLYTEMEGKQEIAQFLASMSLIQLSLIIVLFGIFVLFGRYDEWRDKRKEEARRRNLKRPYLIHLPRCGLEIPAQYIGDYYLNEKELKKNIEQYADLYADELFDSLYNEFGGVKNKYSRFFFDPERFFIDEQEDMSKRGLGWFYEKAILEEKPLRDTKHKEEISKYYIDHHRELNEKVKKKLDLYGKCTIIDCHTFSDERYWFQDEDMELPDICIGFDEEHVDTELVDLIKEEFKEYVVAVNSPYSGSLVPSNFYKKNENVKSVMIEINKKLYLESDNINKNSNYEKIHNHLRRIMETLRFNENYNFNRLKKLSADPENFSLSY